VTLEATTELKARIFYLFVSFIMSFALCYLYSNEYLYLLSKPLIDSFEEGENRGFIFTHMSEAFLTTLFISICVPFFMLIPYLAYSLWLFIVPGLTLNERVYANEKLLLFFFLFLISFLICYTQIIPYMCAFFLNFEVSDTKAIFFNIRLEAKIYDYILFTIQSILLSGVFSIFPIIFLVLIEGGFVHSSILLKWRPLMFVLSFILGGFLSPPDIFSQIFVAFALITLYETSIFYLFFYNRLKNIRHKVE